MKTTSPKWRIALLMLLPLILFSPGCSSFNRDWKKAGSNPSDSIAGRWEGTWKSDRNGHSGKLRCLIDSVSETDFRARFDSTYKKVLRFKSTVVMAGVQTNGAFQFSGHAKLPWWAGGVYEYDGEATPQKFHSTYRNKYDDGTFEMTRPVEP